MQHEELKNFGEFMTPKVSANVMLTMITSLPAELGIIGTPKFLAKMQSKDRYWNRQQFRTAQERGITHPEWMEGIRRSLAFYGALVAVSGDEKGRNAYAKFVDNVGVKMWADFMPKAEDFLQHSHPWDAFTEYVIELFRAWERGNVVRLEIIRGARGEFAIYLTDCAYYALYNEGGYPEIASIGAYGEAAFFARLTKDLGGEFSRQKCLCWGDEVCAWQFRRCEDSD